MTEQTKPINPSLGTGPTGESPVWTDTARDAAFVERIKAHLAQTGMKQGEFAKRIGTNAAYLSDYLRKPEFAYWREVQTLARQWFAKQVIDTEHKIERNDEFIETAPSINTVKALQRMSATNEIGVIYGPGGVGKTEGKNEFLRENRAALSWDCKPWTGFREPWAMERHLIRLLNLRQLSPNPGESRRSRRRSIEDAVELLEGTNRPFIIDDGQFLLASTIDMLAFLNDASGIPIVIITNPILLPRIDARPDQTWSRFGLRIEISAEYVEDRTVERGYRPDEIRAFASQYIERPSAKLLKIAAKVAAGRGHLRRLDKALRHVPKLMLKGRADDEALSLVLTQLGEATQE